MIGLEALRKDKMWRFVRWGERFALGDADEVHHANLVAELGLKKEEVRTGDVDMGFLGQIYRNLIGVRGDSSTFMWPPMDRPEIRAETVRQLREKFPDFKFRG